MKQGVLIYALNNEQIDYVEIAYYAAKQSKKHLGMPVAIITDSADWLYYKFPDHKEVFDMVIKIVHQSDVEQWQSNKHYGIGNLVYYNGTIWRKAKEGNEVVNIINKKICNFKYQDLDRVYEGIDIDKWYPNLPYLAGQHVWHEETLYRCHTDYQEKDNFSLDQYDILLENILEYEEDLNYTIGDIILKKRTLWQANKNKNYKERIVVEFDSTKFEKVYVGIDIDKWYPNLPYLAGQHVWHKGTLYRCHTDYKEKRKFNKNKYDVLIENIVDYDDIDKINGGDIVLYNRNLWLSHSDINFLVSIDTINLENFDRIYEGIEIDKWYPNLPYLKGQHVWHKNTLYRCEIGYTEGEDFSIEKYIIILENVYDLEVTENYVKGDKFLYQRVLWQSKINYGIEQNLVSVWYNLEDLDRVYEGIDIDKWYPNLPYLAGQHVWHEETLYRCHTDYQEKDNFSLDQYDILLENIKDLTSIEKFSIGDILLYDRVLYMSKVNYDGTLNENKIRDDIWEDTKERHVVYAPSSQYRRYYDGSLSNRRLKFKNDIRIKSYELSPFDETLVIDCDYFINNDKLKYCWQQNHDFLIFKDAMDLANYRYDPRLKTLSDKSIDFYWATVFFFRKTKNTEIFFNYLGHIQDNWNYYRYVYQIQNSMYRNDFSFSIAIHVMNGYQEGSWAQPLPGKLYYTIDKDILLEYKDTEMKFLVEKEKYKGEYTLLKTKGLNIHVMNKFSISRIFKEVDYV